MSMYSCRSIHSEVTNRDVIISQRCCMCEPDPPLVPVLVCEKCAAALEKAIIQRKNEIDVYGFEKTTGGALNVQQNNPDGSYSKRS